MTLLVNIIGAGNLGKTIGHLLARSQLVKIEAICNNSEPSTAKAITFIGQGSYCQNITELPPADITFITTPDDYIVHACEALAKNPSIRPGNIVLHCSGTLTSDALITIKQKGCLVASVHPMRSFAKPELSVAQYAGTYCAVEGDKAALTVICPLFDAIGSITYAIEKLKKSSYHAAAVFASNYVVTLAGQALSCMNQAGVEDTMAMKVITSIMQSTVSNLENTLSPEASLTGPIKRGDTATIIKHIAALTQAEQKHLYAALGKATLQLTNHNREKKDAITSALSAPK